MQKTRLNWEINPEFSLWKSSKKGAVCTIVSARACDASRAMVAARARSVDCMVVSPVDSGGDTHTARQ